MSEIEFRCVEKTFPDGTHAVQEFSLTVPDSEFMVFVGPSGCGKSTLLRILAGLEEVSAGEVLIGGEVVNDRTPQERNVAMVFQNYALYPHMTVRRNLEFPLRMAKLAKDEIHRRVTKTAELLRLIELLERKPRQLSGGQRQRVAMGRAVVRNPSVSLMDEPLSNLDAKLRVQIRTEIAALQNRLGTTTIYVTHDQVEAMTLGSRVTVLRDGVLQQVAPPQKLYNRPANIFVASFLGTPGMNLFPARVTQRVTQQGSTGFTLHVGDQPLQFTAEGTVLQNYPLDQPLLAGVRPEALVPIDNGNELVNLSVSVETVESLGHEQLVYCHLPGINNSAVDAGKTLLRSMGDDTDLLVARLPADFSVYPGIKLNLGMKSCHLYLFNMDGTALYPHGE